MTIVDRILGGRPSSCAMLPLRLITVTAAMMVLAAATPPVGIDTVGQEIEQRLASEPAPSHIGSEPVDGAALAVFYRQRQWRPAWEGDTSALQSLLGAAGDEGLGSLPLHLKAIASLNAGTTAAAAADSDMLLTDAVLRYAAAMRGQRVDPADIEDDWYLGTPSFDPVAFLTAHHDDIATALAGLAPPYDGYRLLREQLAKLRAVAAAGDWPKVPTGPTIRPNDSNDRVPAVRRRLEATGELANGLGDSAVYDDTLQAAVVLFQRRHGLTDDGLLGPQTVAAMNVPAAQRARQVALNMERWRWLPPRLEDQHILVNVPGAWLEVVDKGQVVMSMRAIVGDPDHPTPALRARMVSLVLNPIWRVPASIATQEILPQLKKNPGYLVANDLELVSPSFPPGSPESQGVGISWDRMTTMPWPVRQRAGSDNALGRIKFNLPNDDDIYLHDTPNHKLFARTNRALSHGCVRVEHADELALYLLRDKGWTEEKLDEELATGDTKSVALPKSLPVWLLYFTAWVDADGVLQFRDDLYDRDQRLAVALSQASRQAILLARGNPGPTVAKKICDGCRIP